MSAKIKNSSYKYPKAFWVLIFSTFIDRLGAFMLFPFFSLYVTEKFSVGLIEVGILFSLFSVGGIVGGLLGGAFSDKFGRKVMMIFGLIMSGLGSIVMGLVNSFDAFLIVALILGFLGETGGPARQAMIADLLPEDRQADGFGIIRVAVNLSATIGPALGGFLLFIPVDYMVLFISDAASSFITAIIVFFVIPETMPEKKEKGREETLGQTIIGYFEVIKDWVYMAFIVVSMGATLVYMMMNSTLSVFLLEVYEFPEGGYGLLLSMNALMVVLFQFVVTRIVTKFAPMKMMALGTFLYAIGFVMYGFVSEISMLFGGFISSVAIFFIAMIIITIGEMIAMPVSQSIAARFAPEDKRGRYMAVFGFSWTVPMLFGITLMGWIYETSVIRADLSTNLLWYVNGIIALFAVGGYIILHNVAKHRFSKIHQVPDATLKNKEAIEKI